MRKMFDFKCQSCHHVTEKYIDDTVTAIECPHCGNVADKILSATRGFNFVGSGFYETDFKSKK